MKSSPFTYMIIACALVAGGCSEPGTPSESPSDAAPAYASLDLQTDFRNDEVRITLDGKPVFDARVTTDPARSLASRIAITSSPGLHRVQAEVADTGVRTDLMISIQDTTTVRFVYDRTGGILQVSTVPFLIAYN